MKETMMPDRIKPEDIRLEGGGMCPEQYDAYDPEGNQVAYLRLRHGYFTVRMPHHGLDADVLFEAYPEGYGSFTGDERERYLDLARRRIAAKLNNDRELRIAVTLPHDDARTIEGLSSLLENYGYTVLEGEEVT